MSTAPLAWRTPVIPVAKSPKGQLNRATVVRQPRTNIIIGARNRHPPGPSALRFSLRRLHDEGWRETLPTNFHRHQGGVRGIAPVTMTDASLSRPKSSCRIHRNVERRHLVRHRQHVIPAFKIAGRAHTMSLPEHSPRGMKRTVTKCYARKKRGK